MRIIKKVQLIGLFILIGFTVVSLTSCEKDELTATINVLSPNNKSGDVKGNGGTATRTWTFTNSNTRAGWDMSINASNGNLRLVLEDGSGTVVLDQILTAGSGPQSADGTTPEGGIAGTWTATVTLNNFNGSGDYSFL